MSSMEIYWSWLSVGLLLAFTAQWLLSSAYKGSSSPRRFPIIGHIHLLRSFPHRALFNLSRKYGDVMFLKLGFYPTLIISSAAAAREALKTHDAIFSSRPALTQSLIFGYNRLGVLWSPYGEHWRRIRKVCTLEVLTSKQVELSRPVRTQELLRCISELLELSARNEPVNLELMLTDLTFNAATKMLFGKSISATQGKENEEARAFKESIIQGFAASGDFLFGDYIPWLRLLDRNKISHMKDIVRVMDTYLQKQVDEHRRSSHEFRDLLSIMLQNEHLSAMDSTLKVVVLDMVAAGMDTGAVTVEWALAELIRNPKLMSKAQHELDTLIGKHALVNETDLVKLEYLTAVVKETLRLHPPGPLMYYETTQDCFIKNTFVPGETRAIVNVYSIGREKASWDDPLKFDPERFIRNKRIDVRGHDFELIPFGAGRRVCPGIQLGLVVVQVTLANLLHGFNWILPNGMKHEELDMSEGKGLTVPRAVPLVLVPTPRLDSKAYTKLLF